MGSRLNLAPRVPWAFQRHQKLIHKTPTPPSWARTGLLMWPSPADAKLGLGALLLELGKGTASEWSREDVAGVKEETYREIKAMAPLQVGIIETVTPGSWMMMPSWWPAPLT